MPATGGDAERGLSLLRRAGAPPDHQLVELLEHFRPTPRPGLGRNDRCWCGSGRKYKVCHLHREQLPLEERAARLYQKAGSPVLVAGRVRMVGSVPCLSRLRRPGRGLRVTPRRSCGHSMTVWPLTWRCSKVGRSLARNLDDLRKVVCTLTNKGLSVEFIKEHLTFTGEDSPIANLMLSVIGRLRRI